MEVAGLGRSCWRVCLHGERAMVRCSSSQNSPDPDALLAIVSAWHGMRSCFCRSGLFTQCPNGGSGIWCRSHSRFRARCDIGNVAAALWSGSDHTRSYRPCPVISIRLAMLPVPLARSPESFFESLDVFEAGGVLSASRSLDRFHGQKNGLSVRARMDLRRVAIGARTSLPRFSACQLQTRLPPKPRSHPD